MGRNWRGRGEDAGFYTVYDWYKDGIVRLMFSGVTKHSRVRYGARMYRSQTMTPERVYISNVTP